MPDGKSKFIAAVRNHGGCTDIPTEALKGFYRAYSRVKWGDATQKDIRDLIGSTMWAFDGVDNKKLAMEPAELTPSQAFARILSDEAEKILGHGQTNDFNRGAG